jgi:hypothetical protein
MNQPQSGILYRRMKNRPLCTKMQTDGTLRLHRNSTTTSLRGRTTSSFSLTGNWTPIPALTGLGRPTENRSDVESFYDDDDPMSGHWMGIGSSDEVDDDDENDDGSSDDSGDSGDDDGGARQICDEMAHSKHRWLHGSLFW